MRSDNNPAFNGFVIQQNSKRKYKYRNLGFCDKF